MPPQSVRKSPASACSRLRICRSGTRPRWRPRRVAASTWDSRASCFPTRLNVSRSRRTSTTTGRRCSRCAADRGAPLNFHLNAAIDPNALTWDGFEFEQTLAVVATMFSIGNVATLGNWIVSGRLDRHPKLKIGLIESGMGWVPFALEALEHQFDEMLPSKSKLLQRRPWDYFRDQFWVTYWFENVGPKMLLETVGCRQSALRNRLPASDVAVPRRSGAHRRYAGRLRQERAQESPRDQRGQALQPAVLSGQAVSDTQTAASKSRAAARCRRSVRPMGHCHLRQPASAPGTLHFRFPPLPRDKRRSVLRARRGRRRVGSASTRRGVRPGMHGTRLDPGVRPRRE